MGNETREQRPAPQSSRVSLFTGAVQSDIYESWICVFAEFSLLAENLANEALPFVFRFRDPSIETVPLPVDEQILEREHMRWFRHPVQEHLKVDEGGTHVYDTNKKKFVKMRQRTNKKSGYVDITLTVPGGRRYLSRFALECFLKRSLQKGEEADHRNRDRKDNSKDNLRPLFRLGNANNKQSKYICPYSKVQGVHLKFKKRDGKPKCFVAKAQMYAPDGPTRSSQIERRFATGTTEEDYEEALQAAIAWRNRHTLKDGML